MTKPLLSHKAFYARTARARDLRNLFQNWNRLLSQATTRLAFSRNPDSPFWYGERSHVGWLALAAHETGWLPLQEPYVARKGKNAGRTDLWGIRGHGKKSHLFDFEAKFANLNLSTFKPEACFAADDINGKLSRAVKQTRSKLIDYKGDFGIGLVFILLYTRHGTTKHDQLALLRIFKKAATSTETLLAQRADFLALYIADSSSVTEVVKSNDFKYEPSLGVAVLGRFAKRRRKRRGKVEAL